MNNKQQTESKLTRIGKEAANSLFSAWYEITSTARAISRAISPDLPQKDLSRLHKQMQNCLLPKGGEVSARNNTIELGKTYLELSAEGKKNFLIMLLEKFDINHDELQNITKTISTDTSYQKQLELKGVITSPRERIIKQFVSLSNGLKFIVDMRSDVLKYMREHQGLRTLENELRNILLFWFDVGLLDMKRISWNSPASLLEKLIEYEAVHQIHSWSDLKNRLDMDRRCFAFFHHKMPTEPLIFVEVALTSEIATNVQDILDESAPTLKNNINTAVFYSISNAQHGLKGISLGNFLIKKVVEELSHEFTTIKNFITLSPITGFIEWLKANLDDIDIQPEEKILIQQKEYHESLEKTLLKICAYYLLEAKRKGKAIDPVANFHLSNGATIKQINWSADNSTKGLQQSYGIMVNYHYELNRIEENHEQYISQGSIKSSRSVQSLAKQVKIKKATE